MKGKRDAWTGDISEANISNIFFSVILLWYQKWLDQENIKIAQVYWYQSCEWYKISAQDLTMKMENICLYITGNVGVWLGLEI